MSMQPQPGQLGNHVGGKPMKEYDLSLILVGLNESDYQSVSQLVGEELTNRPWNGLDGVEIFGKVAQPGNLLTLLKNFLQCPRFQNLLNLRCSKILRIGVFFDTATCHIDLEPEIIADFEQFGLGLLVSCYPCVE